MELSDTLVELVESGVSVVYGTCNDRGHPDCGRALGARISADRRRLTIVLNTDLCQRSLSDLEQDGRIAVAVTRIHDHHSIQLKGRAVAVREAQPDDAAIVERYLVAFAEQLSVAGLPRSVVQRIRRDNLVVVEIEVDALFDQTPGPGAGERVSA